MKTLPSEAVDALGDDKLVISAAARLALPSGTVRLWSGYGELAIDGEPFKGIGAKALLTPITADNGGSATGIEIQLSGLDPDVAASIEDEDYQQKPITIWRLIFDAKGVNLLAAPIFMRGRLDVAPITETIGGPSIITFKIEGPRLDMNRKGSRIRSDPDQRTIGGTIDGALRHITVAGQKTLTWGQKPAAAPLSRPWFVGAGAITGIPRPGFLGT